MDEEESNLRDTIENDMKNRDKGPVRSKIEDKAKKEAKKAAKKANKKLKNAVFKKTGLSAIIGFLPLFIIVFMIVGIVSFITSMPGLVQEMILNKMINVGNSFNYFINGSDYYLTQLAKDSDNESQKEILIYIDDMGIDPVGYGFAAFYKRTTDDAGNDKVTYEPNIDIKQDIKEVNGFFDAISYNDDVAKEKLKEDLLLKYIISNERAFLVHDLDKVGNTILGESVKDWLGKISLSGMIETKINGLDDSTISVDRENKEMVIKSINFKFDWFDSEIYTQTAKYNLETWAGRYGMPLEFLLALHIGTMTSDLTNEMLENANLQTKVKVDTNKDNYDVSYDIKYNGIDLPFPAKPGGTNDKLRELRDHFVLDGSEIKINLSDDELKAYKDDISINSLQGLIDAMKETDWNPGISLLSYELVNQDAIDAFLSDGMYWVRYELIGDSASDTDKLWRTSAFVGEMYPMNDTYRDKGYTYNPYIFSYDNDVGLRDNIKAPHYDFEDDFVIVYIDTKSDYTYSQDYNAKIYLNPKTIVPIDLTDYGYQQKYRSYEDERTIFTTGRMYGLEKLKGNIWEVSREAMQWGIACMLSQIDSYFYYENLPEFDGTVEYYKVNREWDNEREVMHVDIWVTDDEKVCFDLPDGLNVYTSNTTNIHWNLTYHWLQFLKDNENNLSADVVNGELNYLKAEIEKYNEAITHKNAAINSAIKRLLKTTYGIELTADEVEAIYDALSNSNDDFEFCFPKIEYVIKHWYKDVIFDAAGVDVYQKTSEPLRLPTQVDPNSPLEITAVLSGGNNYKQTDEPVVVKGDIVTQDGVVIENSDMNSKKIEGYTLGDGYRTTKKLFTQGQYYTYDGSQETAKSIWYAKQLEKLNGSNCKFAKAYVQEGRIILSWVYDGSSQPAEFNGVYLGNNSWDTSQQNIFDERKNDTECLPKNAVKVGDISKGEGNWSVYLAMASESSTTDLPVNLYYIVANEDMKYISPAVVDDVNESKKSVERINAMLDAMGVVTIRKPISFDNRTIAGDVTTLTAFGLLEGMHTESAEYIYRDLKEFLIELGYYTKAEFEMIEANVLEWFIPKYIPATDEERHHWNQASDEDALKYGAIIYPTKIDNDGNVEHQGFDADLDVIAPGNCRVIEVKGKEIKIEFDGMSEPEIGALDKYTMIISGIDVTQDVVKVLLPDGSFASKTLQEIEGQEDVVVVGEVIGKTGTEPIQVILKNRIGGYVSDIQDFMAPKSEGKGTYTTQKYKFTEDEKLLLAYVIQKEAAPEGLASYMDTKGSVYATAEEQAMAYAEAVGYVLINRALQDFGGYGNTIEEQSSNPTQYSSGYTIAKAKEADKAGAISSGSKKAAEFCAQYGCQAVVNPQGIEMSEDVTGESAWTFGHKVFWWIDMNKNGKQDIYATSKSEATATKPYPVEQGENPGNDPKLQEWPWDGYLTYSN